jgi:hypothetical protein
MVTGWQREPFTIHTDASAFLPAMNNCFVSILLNPAYFAESSPQLPLKLPQNDMQL